jgi:type IV pilus assembly protein PilF
MIANRLLIVLIGMAAFGCVTTTDVNQRPASEEEQAQANLALGTGYLRQGNAEAAIQPLERAVEAQPRLAVAHSTLALAYDQTGQAEDAERHYRRALSLDPKNAEAQNSYGVFLCRQNRFDDAEEHFVAAARTPRYATPIAALNNAATCAYDAGRLDKADQYFRAALDIDPSNAEALNGLLELALQNENYLQARAFVQRSLASRDPDARLLYECFNVEEELGNTAAATSCLQQLRTLFPGSQEYGRILETGRDAGR